MPIRVHALVWRGGGVRVRREEKQAEKKKKRERTRNNLFIVVSFWCIVNPRVRVRGFCSKERGNIYAGFTACTTILHDSLFNMTGPFSGKRPCG